jgi:hypothetical protein
LFKEYHIKRTLSIVFSLGFLLEILANCHIPGNWPLFQRQSTKRSFIIRAVCPVMIYRDKVAVPNMLRRKHKVREETFFDWI